MRVIVREVRTLSKRPDWSVIVKEIEEKMDREAKPLAIAEFDKVIKGWSLDLKFKATKRIRSDEIVVYVYPSGKDAFIWKILSITGSGLYGPKHAKYEIKPKATGYPLRFQWGGPGSYNPKTKPVAQYGGPGTVSGGTERRFMSVMHPGIEPRLFEPEIGKRLLPRFRQIVRNAIRIGKRKARAAGVA